MQKSDMSGKNRFFDKKKEETKALMRTQSQDYAQRTYMRCLEDE